MTLNIELFRRMKSHRITPAGFYRAKCMVDLSAIGYFVTKNIYLGNAFCIKGHPFDCK